MDLNWQVVPERARAISRGWTSSRSSCLTRCVVHGTERRYRAFFRDLHDAEAEPEPRAITLEEAVALGTEDGWADTSERLIKVLWWPQRPHRAARRGPKIGRASCRERV